MTADEFLALERLPTADEFVALCGGLGIGFGVNEEGKPVLKVNRDNAAIGRKLAQLLRREPWRSQVIAANELNAGKPDRKPDRKARPWPETSTTELRYGNGQITRAADDEQPAGLEPTHLRVSQEEGWIAIPKLARTGTS